MRLKQIRLSGFKSFVDNTAIEVVGQLVGIVGPNGCGKSNVIDAVRWVLGESSAKQLRGESMADVIFNGSLKRKPVSRASVELVFDNTLKSLSGLWNTYDEVAIKRVISRQGESSYLINNQQVRRKDITDLFLGTGVGSKGYAVIEQGMISRIIESRPEDMRLFVEEAAGVSKYRERRKETVMRLNDTRDNLLRLEDIHGEIIKQLAVLKEQAETAKLYQELNQELKLKQGLVLAVKVRDAKKIQAEASQFIQNCEDELRTIGYQLEEVNEQLTREQELKTTKEQQFQDLMQGFNEYRTQLARVEERYKHYTELLQRFETETGDLNERLNTLTEEISEYGLRIEEIDFTIEDKQLQLNEEEIIRDQFQESVFAGEASYQEIQAKSQMRQSKLNQLKHDCDLLANSCRHKEQQHANLLIRKQRLVEETNTLDLDQNYHFIKEEVELIKEDLISSELNLEKITILHEEISGKLQLIQQEKQLLSNQQSASIAKIDTLSKLIQKSMLNDSGFASDANELWQMIKVSDGYELAVEVAIASLLKAKIIENIPSKDDINEHKIALWFKDNSTNVKINPKSLSQYVTIKDQGISSLYSYLNQFILIDNIDTISALEENCFYITRDGHLFTRYYAIYNAHNDSDNILLHQQELESLIQLNAGFEQKLANLMEEEQELTQRENSLKNDSSSLQSANRRLMQKKHDLEVELTKQEQMFIQNQRHLERTTEEIQLITQEINHLANEISDLQISLEEKRLTLSEYEVESQNIELERLESETAHKLAENKLNDINGKINQLIIDLQMLRQQKNHSEQIKKDKELQLAAIKANLAKLADEKDSFNNSTEAEEINGLQQHIADIAGKMQSVQGELNELSNKIVSLKNKASSLNSNYQRNLEKINQTKFKLQEQQILLSTYRESCEEHGLNEDTLAELMTNAPKELNNILEEAKSLEARIAELGLVNLKAIEDLELASAKEEELIFQLDDLRQAIINLEAAIEHIDNETRTLLQATFDKLNAAIQVYFKALFGGGNAKLALTEKDILNAGVQIFAEPPGKKNSTIHLLSGGEKALAAMSFIFALFSLNPAPFCLLDEVDAPLDDANTSRFCNLVKDLSDKTQFVYISHNRLAMEMADQLVGVTMQEKGVSTVVSVSLIDAVNQINAEQSA